MWALAPVHLKNTPFFWSVFILGLAVIYWLKVHDTVLKLIWYGNLQGHIN